MRVGVCGVGTIVVTAGVNMQTAGKRDTILPVRGANRFGILTIPSGGAAAILILAFRLIFGVIVLVTGMAGRAVREGAAAAL